MKNVILIKTALEAKLSDLRPFQPVLATWNRLPWIYFVLGLYFQVHFCKFYFVFN